MSMDCYSLRTPPGRSSASRPGPGGLSAAAEGALSVQPSPTLALARPHLQPDPAGRPAGGRARPDRGGRAVFGARVLQDGRFPPRLDPGRHRRHPELGAANDFSVTATEDATAFTDANLAQFATVVWLSTTGDVLDSAQQAAFERYIRAGGGYVGIHAASDTEYDWAWYGELVGAYFTAHPANQQATIKVEDPAHPSTADLPASWSRFDEWYNFRTNPRGTGARAGQPGRAQLLAGHRARWAPTTRSPGVRTSRAVVPGTQAAATPSSRTPKPTSWRSARRDPDDRRGRRRRLRRVADRQLREGDAGQQHPEPDGARRRPGRPRVLHRARRPGADHQAADRAHRRPRSTWTCSPATRTACSASGSTRISPPTIGCTCTTRPTTA